MAIVVKPIPFAGKPEEDPEDWMDRFERIADANEWDAARKLQIVPAYLTDRTKRWFVAHAAFTDWTNGQGVNPVNFKEDFMVKFIIQKQQNDYIQQLVLL